MRLILAAFNPLSRNNHSSARVASMSPAGWRRERSEDTMPTKEHGQIVETPTEARQGERGPSVLALLTISTGLAIVILGVIWFVFIRV